MDESLASLSGGVFLGRIFKLVVNEILSKYVIYCIHKMIFIYSLFLLGTIWGQGIKKKVDPNEKYVTELKMNSFQKLIDKEDYLLVDFFTNWCQHCKEFEPELNRLGKMCFDKGTAEVSIQVAKFNMEEDADRSIGSKYQIRYFPFIVLFIKGIPIEYKDEQYKTASSIYSWMQQVPTSPHNQLDPQIIQPEGDRKRRPARRPHPEQLVLHCSLRSV